LTASSGLAALTFEVLCLKLGFYLISDYSSVPLLDLVAYCGYAFLGIVLNMLVGVVLGSACYYLSLLWTGVCMGIFMVKTLRLLVQSTEPSQQNMGFGGQGSSATNKRNYLLFAAAIIQPLISYFLGVVL